MKRDDIHIIREVLSGKSGEYVHILNRYGKQVFNLIAHIIPCKEDAEELTQDVFIKVFRQLSSFKEDSSFSTWLYRIATNTALSAARKRKHDTLQLDDAVYKDIPDEIIDEALDNSSEEQLQKLSEAIDKLNAEEQALITLYYMNERPIEEVATIMGMTQSNVKIKLYRTRKKLYLILNNL